MKTTEATLTVSKSGKGWIWKITRPGFPELSSGWPQTKAKATQDGNYEFRMITNAAFAKKQDDAWENEQPHRESALRQTLVY